VASSLKSASLASLSASFLNKQTMMTMDDHHQQQQYLGQSLGTSFSAQRIREIIEEEHVTSECESPEASQPKGVLLKGLQRQAGIISPQEAAAQQQQHDQVFSSVGKKMAALTLDAQTASSSRQADADDDDDVGVGGGDDDELQFELS